MRLHKSWHLALALVAGISAAGWTYCDEAGIENQSAAPDAGKIPITTKSEEARREFLLGRGLFDRGLVQDSIPHFDKAIALDPEFASAELARATSAVRDPKGVFEHVSKAVNLADKVSEGERLLILATEAQLKGDAAKAKSSLEKLVADYPGDERAQYELATFYLAAQQYQVAIDYYKTAAALAPNFPPTYSALGYCYQQQGNYSDAAAALKKYTELAPDSPDPYDSYAELLLKMGKFEESIAQYRKALAVDPHFESSRYGISANEMYLGRPNEAQAALQEMEDKAESESDRRAAYFGMAVLACDGGKFDQALRSVDKMYALSIKSNDPTAIALVLELQGWIMVEMGNYSGAKTKFDGALQSIATSNLPKEVKDNWTLTREYDLGGLAIAQSDYASARIHAAELGAGPDASKKLSPADLRRGHSLSGRIALGEKHYDVAIAELKQANMENPRNLYCLALAYQGEGDSAKAQEYLTKVVDFNSLPSIDYAFIRAKARKMAGNKKSP